MGQKKLVIYLLLLLVAIKFAYIPWSQWIDDQQGKIDQLVSFSAKQQKAIENKELLKSKLVEHEADLAAFAGVLPVLNSGEKANTLWFNLIESMKNERIKIYNQQSEFESLVTAKIGYVTGTFYISGEASDVMKAVLALEQKSPYVFIDKLALNRSLGGQTKSLVAQLYVGYWFIHDGAENNG